MALKFVQSNTLYEAGAGVIVGATTVILTSFKDIYGNVLTMADFGSKGYITLEPDTTNEEAATFTGVVANANGTYSLTGVKTALAKSPYTETNGLVRGHAGGTKVVITDNVAFWNTFTNKNNNEIIDGQWTFNNTPIVPGTVSDASITVKGVSKLSVAPVLSTSPIAVGDNDPRIIAGGGLLAGIISPYAGSSAPAGWLLCDGSAVSQSTYANLYAICGTTYGNPGGGNFNLPDLRGKIPVGLSSDTEFNALAKTGGEKTHQLTTAELASHTHSLTSTDANSPQVSPGYRFGQNYGAAQSTGSTGGDTAHNNLQPYITCYMWKRVS